MLGISYRISQFYIQLSCDLNNHAKQTKTRSTIAAMPLVLAVPSTTDIKIRRGGDGSGSLDLNEQFSIFKQHFIISKCVVGYLMMTCLCFSVILSSVKPPENKHVSYKTIQSHENDIRVSQKKYGAFGVL